MRRAYRKDGNQTKIEEHLRKAGLSVFDTSMVGNGFPDLVVAGQTGWSKPCPEVLLILMKY